MTKALLRRVVAPLMVVVYLVAAMPIASACAHPAPMNSSAMQPASGDQSQPTPSKAIDHGCDTEFCLVCGGVATLPQLARITTTAWSHIHYHQTVPTLHARAFAPPLGPPISVT